MTKPYTPTSDTVIAFTEGDCWLLALTMHEMTGRPMVFANPAPKYSWYWEHVGLQIDLHNILDINGISNNYTWRKKWAGENGNLYRATSPKRIKKLVGGQDKVFNVRPRPVALRLLQAHAPHLLQG